MSIATATQDVLTQLQERIQADVRAFHGELPERYSIPWRAYSAGLAEWQTIATQNHSNLLRLPPKISDPNPITTIFSGRD
jgi:hypothetical protein